MVFKINILIISTKCLFLVDSSSGFNRPILPADLMIALHKIDSSKCDLKTTIKGDFFH